MVKGTPHLSTRSYLARRICAFGPVQCWQSAEVDDIVEEIVLAKNEISGRLGGRTRSRADANKRAGCGADNDDGQATNQSQNGVMLLLAVRRHRSEN